MEFGNFGGSSMGTGVRRLVLTGGFLGAGKTTTIGALVRLFQLKGLRCGVITNDQAKGLVDTSVAETLDGAQVSEIAGGCFCCRLDQLEQELTATWSGDPGAVPDVIIAEPVGSCTDLMATVILPLRRIFEQEVFVSPLSVIVDGRRALASLGGRRTPGSFTKDVGYIYRKQIEEAEILVVNKMDLMEESDLTDLRERICREYPEKELFIMSARTGEGLEKWALRILGAEAAPERLMEVDYERYGLGESLLGWCNAEASVSAMLSADGDTFLSQIAAEISSRLANEKIEVAHLKIALSSADGQLGVINQVMSGVAPEISRPFRGEFRAADVTVNLRAEGDPETLRLIVEACLTSTRTIGIVSELKRMEAFRPGQPVPVERITALK